MISGLTDIIDGAIARKFNMISDVGKVLDPFADKATQVVVMILLAISFPLMIIPIALIAIKEVFMVITGYMVIKKCDIVLGAHWHGKLATVALTAVMVLHLVWYNIPSTFSLVLIILCSSLILLSLALYAKRNFGYLLGKTK
jgi:cardiolipin synthase